MAAKNVEGIYNKPQFIQNPKGKIKTLAFSHGMYNI